MANELALEAAALRIREAGFDNFSLSAATGFSINGVDQRELVVAFGENKLSLLQLGAEEPILRGFLAATESASEQSFAIALSELLAQAPDPALVAEQRKTDQVNQILELIGEVGASSRQGLANSNSALEDTSFAGALLIGIGASFESTIDLVVDVSSAIGDGVEFVIDETGEFASELLNGDTEALTTRYQNALESVEGAADFVGSIPEKAAEIAEQVQQITRIIQENPEIYDAFVSELVDTADDVSAKQVTLAVGAIVGELLIGAATRGAANAAKAVRGAAAGARLVDALLDLADNARTVTRTATRAAGEVVEGFRAGRLALQSPIILDNAALAGRFNSGIPLDAVGFQSLIRRSSDNVLPDIPNRPLSRLLARDEAQAATEILNRASTRTGGLQVFGESNLARLFGVRRNNFNLPEGVIQRNDSRLVAFEVKNQNVPDIGSAIAKFEDVSTLAPRAGLDIGRFDLFVPTGFQRFSDDLFRVNNRGFLTFEGELFRVGNLPVRIIERDLIKP